jgi:hypothetical protein
MPSSTIAAASQSTRPSLDRRRASAICHSSGDADRQATVGRWSHTCPATLRWISEVHLDPSIVSAISLLAAATIIAVVGVWLGLKLISPPIQRHLDRAADEESRDQPA